MPAIVTYTNVMGVNFVSIVRFFFKLFTNSAKTDKPLHSVTFHKHSARYRPLSRRLDRCDRMIQNEYRDPSGGNVRLFSAATDKSQRECPPVRFAL